ncbi:MAG: ATP-binding protein, partial [Proteobacteria bacterium]
MRILAGKRCCSMRKAPTGKAGTARASIPRCIMTSTPGWCRLPNAMPKAGNASRSAWITHQSTATTLLAICAAPAIGMTMTRAAESPMGLTSMAKRSAIRSVFWTLRCYPTGPCPWRNAMPCWSLGRVIAPPIPTMPPACLSLTETPWVMRNILDNAAKYNQHNAPVDIRLQQEADIIVICVIDRGIGLEAAELTRIFKKFYRVGDE